eukprot:m.171468 g.171468  ORF g.171468 m.171468 type:complete len:333 (-) comp31651_c3_seq2:287-1285(-)
MSLMHLLVSLFVALVSGNVEQQNTRGVAQAGNLGKFAIIFMCTDGFEPCDTLFARLAVTAVRTVGQWKGELIMITDSPSDFEDLDIRIHTIPRQRLNHIDSVTRRQKLVYMSNITKKDFVLNVDADIIIQRPIKDLVSRFPNLFTGIAGFRDHGFVHQINCGFLMVRRQPAVNSIQDKCLKQWMEMTARRSPGINWDMEQQSLFLTAQSSPECPTESIDCLSCYRPRALFLSRLRMWNPYYVHYSGTLRLRKTWLGWRASIAREYLECSNTKVAWEKTLCNQPLMLSSWCEMHLEELVFVATIVALKCLHTLVIRVVPSRFISWRRLWMRAR